MSRPFSVKFNWEDFDNTSKLTSYQKHRIRKRYEEAIETSKTKQGWYNLNSYRINKLWSDTRYSVVCQQGFD